MKKLLLSLVTSFGLLNANAQLDDGLKAQDFTFTALNNGSQVVNLYSWLDSGKYVFLDVSATWCGPCWSYHNTHALKDLYLQHGPGTTSNDVRVVFVEGDGTTDDTKMSGGTGSQGNWLSGTPYPMCNPASSLANTFNDNYEINYFPTVYMICPDRTVKEVGTLTAAQLYALVSPTAQCAPKINVDVRPETFTGKLISCNGNFTFDLTIRNRGFNNLTSANIAVKNGTTTITTIPWSGNLATYQNSTSIPVTLNSLNPSYDSLTIEVTATGDQIVSNDKFTVYVDQYLTSNASTLPYTQNFDAGTTMPAKVGFPNNSDRSRFGFHDGVASTTKLTGSNGSYTKAAFVNFYNTAAGGTGVLTITNLNTNTSSQYLNLDWDVAYAQYDGTEDDKLEVVVSTDCGNTWNSVWTKSGATLKTSNATTSSFIPTSASQWRRESANLSAYKNNPNAIVGFRMTSAYGNYAWIDNINIAAGAWPSNIEDINKISALNIFPSPANSTFNVEFLMDQVSDVSFILTDMTGKAISNTTLVNQTGNVSQVIDCKNLANGIYNLSIKTKNETLTKKVTVAH